MAKTDGVGYKVLRTIFTISVWATLISAALLRIASCMLAIGLRLGLMLSEFVHGIHGLVFPAALLSLVGLFVLRYLEDRKNPGAKGVARLSVEISPWLLKLDVAYLGILVVYYMLGYVIYTINYRMFPDPMMFLWNYLIEAWPFLVLAAVLPLVHRICSKK